MDEWIFSRSACTTPCTANFAAAFVGMRLWKQPSELFSRIIGVRHYCCHRDSNRERRPPARRVEGNQYLRAGPEVGAPLVVPLVFFCEPGQSAALRRDPATI